MANQIVVKHRSSDATEPSGLLAGEIAANINASGKKIFIGTGSGNVVFADQSWIEANYTNNTTLGTSYQPLDTDLTNIAALTGTAGILTTDGSNGWSVDTNTYLTTTAAGTTYQPLDAELTGISALTTAQYDTLRATGSGNYQRVKNNITTSDPVATDDTSSGYVIGSMWYNTNTDKAFVALDVSASAAVWIDVTSQGSATAIVDADFASEGVMYRGATAGTYSIKTIGTDIQAWDGDLDAIAALAGTTGILTKTAANTWSLDTNTYLTDVTTANIQASTLVTAAEGIGSNDNDTTLPTSAAVKAYVDTAVAGGVSYKGAYNASTNTPDLDTSPSGVLTGDMYTVTVAGTFFTIDLEVGDVLIAETDSASAEADWTIVQRNILNDQLIDGGTY